MQTVLTDEQALEAIAYNVRRYRGDRSYSDVARISKTYRAPIVRGEKGRHMPGAGLLSRLAEALGVTVDDLLMSDRIHA